MRKAQRDRVVQLLSDGTTLREAASIAQVPWPEFVREWNVGRTAHETKEDNAAARWYSLCQAERSAFKATIRTLALSKAGMRASSDALALLKHLESEEDPRNDETTPPVEISIVNSPEAREAAILLTEALAAAQVRA